MTAPTLSTPPRRRRRWVRRVLIGLAVLVVLLLAGTAAAVKLQPVPDPLALPAAAAAPTGASDGTWAVGPGSLAGFRIRQVVIGLSSDVVGRTTGLTGTATVTGDKVTGADVQVDLRALTSGDKPAPSFTKGLDTDRYPTATLRLNGPIPLGPGFATGAVTTASATVQLTLHGVSRPVTVPLQARRSGDAVQVSGRFPVSFADHRITSPGGIPFLGDLDDHGVAEFLLVLHRA